MKTVLLSALAIIAVFAGSAATADDGANKRIAPPPADTGDHEPGRQIYVRSCSVCHGERGNAVSWAKNSLNPPPRDFTSAKGRQLNRERMIGAVTHGVPGTAMVSFTTQFSSDEIRAVVDYVRSAFMGIDTDPPGEMLEHAKAGEGQAPAVDHDHATQHGGAMNTAAAFPGALVGRVDHGKASYENNCVACHGLEGNGKGPRAYFLSRKPRDFTSQQAKSELNRPHLFEAIAKGVRQTEMAAWSKVLSAQEIADVAEYVFAAFIDDSQRGQPSPRLGQGEEHSKKN